MEDGTYTEISKQPPPLTLEGIAKYISGLEVYTSKYLPKGTKAILVISDKDELKSIIQFGNWWLYRLWEKWQKIKKFFQKGN